MSSIVTVPAHIFQPFRASACGAGDTAARIFWVMRKLTLQTLVGERAEQVFLLRESVLAGWDADAVHDLRVATRRLQEAVAFGGPWLDRRAAARLRRRARSIRRSLGDLRNADVLADLLSGCIRELPAGLRPPARDLRRKVAARAAALRAAGKLGGLRIPAIASRAEALGAAPLPSPVAALGDRARAVLERRALGVADAMPSALTGDPVALHRLRIAFKRWRYVLEILQAIHVSCGFPTAPALKSARELQTSLGQLHDLDVLIDLLGSQPGFGRAALLSHLRIRRRESLPLLLGRLQAFQIPHARGPRRPRGLTAS
jgi:CHAD domain-containing protein